MNLSRWLRFTLVLAACFSPQVMVQGQEKIDPKTQALVESLQKILPEYEQAAEVLEGAAQKLAGSKDRGVTIAVDSARLQILSIRSIRKIIAEQPSYLQYHVGTAHLPRWKEG